MMRARILVSLLLASACTQQPAQVVDKSNDANHRNGGSVASIPRYGHDSLVPPATEAVRTVETARIDSIGISDLPPPPKENIELKSVVTPVAKDAKPAEIKLAVKNFPVEQSLPQADLASTRFGWPTASHKIKTPYSKSGGGITIDSGSGEPVYASEGGEVIAVGEGANGLTVTLKHKDGLATSYARLQNAKVEKYARVQKGDVLGTSGDELFFAVRNANNTVDPKAVLK